MIKVEFYGIYIFHNIYYIYVFLLKNETLGLVFLTIGKLDSEKKG